MTSGAPVRPRRRPAVAVLVPAGLALLLVALPVAGLLQRASWSDLPRHLTDPATVDALRVSLVCSLGATVVAVGLGLPLAWVLARAGGRARRVLRALVLLPMVLPPVVGGMALLAAFSRRSPIGGFLADHAGVQLTFTTAGAVLAEAFVALPFFVITAEGALRGLDRRYEEAAATLGARPFVAFRRVTVPLVAPSLVAGAALAWARALGEFGATLTFAGNIEGTTRTLPLAIYLEHDLRPEQAISMSIVLIVVSVAVLVALRDRWRVAS